MTSSPPPPEALNAEEKIPSLPSRWVQKFGNAFRGIAVAFRQEDSFAVHLPVGFAVLAYGALQGVGRIEWLLLVLCCAIVIAAELFNSSIERLASVVTHEIGFARDVSDRVAYFHEGRIEELGPPEQVIGAPVSDQTRKFLANVR